MTANFIKIGESAHDAERQALRFLVDGLPETFTVYGNPWVVERSGVIYELDAVVVAPHAIFVVEMKAYRGNIEGTDNDWYVPHPTPSPLKLNRITAQVLKSTLKRESYQAGQVWVEGFVFLSATTQVGVRGPASRDRVHTRKTILAALQDPAVVERLSGRRSPIPTSAAERELLQIFTGAQGGPKPVRRVREYEIVDTLDHREIFTELLGRNNLSSIERMLRIYTFPPLATELQRSRVLERARWEAQVLVRLGRIEGILTADPPFEDEAGIVLPMEYFQGVTLNTWIERYGPESTKKDKADLRARTDLWLMVARTIDEAHRQGVVHRLLRPEVILVEDKPVPSSIRVAGFDLAKQLSADVTVSLTTIDNERLLFAAPEVVSAFSSAEPASDQFSLGALLAWLLTGRALFESTRQLLGERSIIRRVRDMAIRIPLSLDEAVHRMLSLRPAERYSSLAEAMAAVRQGRESDSRPPALFPERKKVVDADNLPNGLRIGSDYEVIGRLGQGGLATVYAARHLVSGRTRALKIARAEDAAEEALRGEYQTLSELDHSNIVRVIDLTKMVEGRLTLVMERIGGQTLRDWVVAQANPPANDQRRYAEDLLAALIYLEQRNVKHKDLKPDNLLVGDGGLTVIDFSLASAPDDALYCGTALYRDPSSTRWSHATDRYAAALCLFEVYTGRHAFDGHVPEPGQAPSILREDIHPPGLAEFFSKALDPVPEKRFSSAVAMKDALIVALGKDLRTSVVKENVQQVNGNTPLRDSGLSRRAINALARYRVQAIGELLSLSEEQIRAIHAIGRKTASEIICLRENLIAQGAVAISTTMNSESPLVVDLADSAEPVQKLPLSEALRSALAFADLPTVGAVASLTRSQLLKIPGIGQTKLAQVIDALFQFRNIDRPGLSEEAHTLDRIWELASRPLTADQRLIVEKVVGLTGLPETQERVAQDLDKKQPHISADLSRGLRDIDLSMLSNVATTFEVLLDMYRGISRLDCLADRLEEEFPAGIVSSAGIIRLLLKINPSKAHLLILENGTSSPVIAHTIFDKEIVQHFIQETVRLASQWPPMDPDSVRRVLSPLLPNFDGDALALGARLCDNVETAESGHLFIGPLLPKDSIEFVLAQTRENITVDSLERRVQQIFGARTPFPDSSSLMELLGTLNCQVRGNTIYVEHHVGHHQSIMALQQLEPDAAESVQGADRGAEEVVRDMLRDASKTRGFRMLVTLPERLHEVGQSVATALGGKWVSFEDEFFADHGSNIAALERAERFSAQRDVLTEAAEETLYRLLDDHGKPGNIVALGDTALLGLCDALDLPRRLYDETLSGSRGFWVLIVPGVIHNRQPRFNEDVPMWHLEGATVQLLHPLPA